MREFVCNSVLNDNQKEQEREIYAQVRAHEYMHTFDIHTHMRLHEEFQVKGYAPNTVGRVCLIATKVTDDAS